LAVVVVAGMRVAVMLEVEAGALVDSVLTRVCL
jgi:hypothetical protein